MVELLGRSIADARVLAALAAVARERFLPVAHADDAYADLPIPIGYGQQASAPSVVGRLL